MENKLKILLTLSLLGILLLLAVSQFIEPRSISEISDITRSSLNQRVMIKGNITGIRAYNNNTFFVFKVSDKTGNITAVANSDFNLKEKIDASQDYLLTGKVQEYNKTLQLSIEKIAAKVK